MSGDGTHQDMIFELLRAGSDGAAARLGRLALSGRRLIDTPSFLAASSRGTVPHITPDNVSRHKLFGGSYIALEDFVEKFHGKPGRTPPLYEAPVSQKPALHSFAALPHQLVSVLAPRRHPAAVSQMGNGHDYITIFTSTGLRQLTIDDYNSAIKTLRPDIAIPMVDLNYASSTPTSKRAVRMAERSEDWMSKLFQSLPAEELRTLGISVFAPTLPLPYPIQWQYLNSLSESREGLSGLTVYDVDIITDLKDYPDLEPLPRLSLDTVRTPHHILRHVSLGADVLLLPFINSASEAGTALTFAFPPPAPASTESSPLPLGIDLSDPAHQTSLSPLLEGCPCYTCTSHHRAYLHHLLKSGEMLAWTLLQMHNYAVVDAFFAGIRASLAAEPPTFVQECRRFALAYEPEPPEGAGERPRARGYQFKSEVGDEKRNKPAWGKLDATLGSASAPVAGEMSETQTRTPNGASGSGD